MITHDHMFIDGRWVPVASPTMIDVIDPATEEVTGRVAGCSVDMVTDAVVAARKAFPTWSATSTADRAALLIRLNDLVREHAVELAQLVQTEMGSPASFALAEQVGSPIAIIDDYVSILQEETPEAWVGNSLIVHEPIGVVAAITPWNYPLYQLVAKVIPALAAGCTVVVKPPEIAPLSTFRLTELVAEAGFPPGAFNLVNGVGGVVGQSLSAHPDVDMVSFTGSTRTGRQVSATAADTIKRVALELGGKSPSVVLEGADFDTAVRDSVAYCMTNSGQSCDAWTRLLVPRHLQAQAEEIAVQMLDEFENTLGPLVSAEQYQKVQDYIQTGLDEGARLLAGGLGHPEGWSRGYYARPTVFSDVTSSMRVAQEEIFGPVLVIQPYDDHDDAERIANDSQYGLHGAVWAATQEEALAFARRLRTGQVNLNGADANISAPFGGYKQSGNGRELGRFGLHEFQETKAIQV